MHPEGAAPRGRERPEDARWLAGVRERMQRELAEHSALLALTDAVHNAVASIPAQVQDNVQAVAGMATELGLTIAREIVGQVVDQGLFDPTAVVQRCLHEAVAGGVDGDLRVEVAPQDLALIVERFAADRELGARAGGAEFIANPALPRGAVVVATGSGRLVYDPLEVLERISDEIRKGTGQ
ncbi:MAG: hypothetical protein KDC87_11635 [Planctomycetes bacterium]|nr:hypothetical protein [Planctomycetota bacterium]MCB9872238.1 hypothetical protein [Planctomycetota bacterium]